MRLSILRAVVVMATAHAALSVLFAQPRIISPGSALTIRFANSPDTYTVNTTFSATPVLVDNGRVRLWQRQVVTAPDSEWDVFYMETTTGGPVASDPKDTWSISMDVTLSTAAFLDQTASQWTLNGAPVTGISNFLTICCVADSNPILPGPAYYRSGFSAPYPTGILNWQQISITPYNNIALGGINPASANGYVFALHFTVRTGPPSVSGVISAGSFGAFSSFAPGSWIEIYGSNLAGTTQEWAITDFNGDTAPISLGGTKVTIDGLNTYIRYISPSQVNVQVPGDLLPGSRNLLLTTSKGSSAPVPVNIVPLEPGLLSLPSFNLSGNQYAVALFPDGVTYALLPNAIPGVNSRRAKPGDTLTLYGVGFGPVTPNIPPGQIARQVNTLTTPLAVSFGGITANPLPYAGLAPNFVGLYQINVVVPNVNPGDFVPLSFILGGVPGTQRFLIPIGN